MASWLAPPSPSSPSRKPVFIPIACVSPVTPEKPPSVSVTLGQSVSFSEVARVEDLEEDEHPCADHALNAGSPAAEVF